MIKLLSLPPITVRPYSFADIWKNQAVNALERNISFSSHVHKDVDRMYLEQFEQEIDLELIVDWSLMFSNLRCMFEEYLDYDAMQLSGSYVQFEFSVMTIGNEISVEKWNKGRLLRWIHNDLFSSWKCEQILHYHREIKVNLCRMMTDVHQDLAKQSTDEKVDDQWLAMDSYWNIFDFFPRSLIIQTKSTWFMHH